jgi:hypothetical protein
MQASSKIDTMANRNIFDIIDQNYNKISPISLHRTAEIKIQAGFLFD